MKKQKCFVNREVLLSYIMACGSQCHQRQYRRQGTKLDRYWGITKHRKERSLRGRMHLVTLQHDLSPHWTAAYRQTCLSWYFLRLLTEFQTFSLPGKLHHDGIKGYPTVDHILHFWQNPVWLLRVPGHFGP